MNDNGDKKNERLLAWITRKTCENSKTVAVCFACGVAACVCVAHREKIEQISGLTGLNTPTLFLKAPSINDAGKAAQEMFPNVSSFTSLLGLGSND